jgi:uncharacterized protein YbaR (Trm112 family)
MDLSWLDSFLPLLRCPVSKQPLRLASAEEKRAASLRESEPALASEDGVHVYPVSDGIPILLPQDSTTNDGQ